MSQITNSISPEGLAREDHGALEMRLFRVMIASVALAVIASTMLLPWRGTTGVVLGGFLSLWDFHWLPTSGAAVFRVGAGGRPPGRGTQFCIRFFLVSPPG